LIATPKLHENAETESRRKEGVAEIMGEVVNLACFSNSPEGATAHSEKRSSEIWLDGLEEVIVCLWKGNVAAYNIFL